MVADCPFCEEDLVLEDIVYESENFFGFIGLGLAVEGHALFISKDHIPCFAELDDGLEEQYFAARGEFLDGYRKAFGEPFIVECGVWGQSVPHAHLHLVPLSGEDYDIESIVEEMIARSGIPYWESDFDGIKDFYAEHGQYFSWEEHGRIYLCDINGVEMDKSDPHMNIRSYFRHYHGIEGVSDWRNMTKEDYALDRLRRNVTRERLKRAFR